MLEPERHSERVAVYVTPSFRERLTRTIEASGVEQSHWLRRVLEAEIFRFELGETQEQEANAPDGSRDPSVPPAVALAAAEARIEGMQEIVNLQRERLGMADALNVELTRRLEFAQISLDRVTLMLPAPGETSEPRGFNWRFWRR